MPGINAERDDALRAPEVLGPGESRRAGGLPAVLPALSGRGRLAGLRVLPGAYGGLSGSQGGAERPGSRGVVREHARDAWIIDQVLPWWVPEGGAGEAQELHSHAAARDLSARLLHRSLHGERLFFPGVLLLLGQLFPQAFPRPESNEGWRVGKCHWIYWRLWPTLDHVVPVARGGHPTDESNLVTTSQVINTAKSVWTAEEAPPAIRFTPSDLEVSADRNVGRDARLVRRLLQATQVDRGRGSGSGAAGTRRPRSVAWIDHAGLAAGHFSGTTTTSTSICRGQAPQRSCSSARADGFAPEQVSTISRRSMRSIWSG